eukprot:scaffold268193_cov21-Prasinocladus_malaysianus.AAC.1
MVECPVAPAGTRCVRTEGSIFISKSKGSPEICGAGFYRCVVVSWDNLLELPFRSDLIAPSSHVWQGLAAPRAKNGAHKQKIYLVYHISNHKSTHSKILKYNL